MLVHGEMIDTDEIWNTAEHLPGAFFSPASIIGAAGAGKAVVNDTKRVP